MKILLMGWLSTVLLFTADARAADQYRFFGHHPSPPGKGGFCYLNGAHVHPYQPHRSVAHLFRNQGGSYYFVGDPYHFGYAHPAFAYDNHHPIHVVFGGGWCYLDGPHYHFFHPHRSHVKQYTIFGDRYYYVGPVGPLYHQLRPVLYKPEPPYVAVEGYSPVFASHVQYSVQYGRPASVVYVSRGKLPKARFVRGMYAGAYFGLPGISAGVTVGLPGVSAHIGVRLPSVGFGIHVGGPSVVVAPGRRPRRYPPGWFRGKKKGWFKWERGKKGKGGWW